MPRQMNWNRVKPVDRDQRDAHLFDMRGPIDDGDQTAATIDHVKPLSRGGDTSWENCVTCCVPCNRRKADKLPMECGLLPKRTPKRPLYVQTAWAGMLEQIQKEYVADYFRVAVELL